ncbi:DUF2868 domain-containing protein [bacterium]|nr:DUF2868 domain-containing protein [bacterium]
MKLPPPPSLSELIDLEQQFEADAAVSRAQLVRRDAEIGRSINASALDGIALYRAWLGAVRDPDQPCMGRQVDQLRRWVTAALVVGGFLIGLVAVSGWLSMASGRPINVIHLWAVMVGVQLMLLLGWILVILPERWLARIPGIEPLQWMLRAVARVVPTAAGWVGLRLGVSGGDKLRDLYARLRRLDWQYGRVRFWLLLRLTQIFAVSFNIGAALGFVIMATVSDPALGWRSSLLNADHVHAAARTIALPWSRLVPQAVPTREEIEATQYSSLEQRYVRGGPAAGTRVWAAWLPFMLASLLCYGFAPRLLALAFAHWRYRRALRDVDFSHADFQRLRERLVRPQIETQSEESEEPCPAGAPGIVAGLDVAPAQSPLVLKWAGVGESDSGISQLVQLRLGVQPRRVMTVGALDTNADAAALAEAASDAAPVVLIVESWEPPVGDYLDFLAALREHAPRRPIIVLLYQCNEEGRPAAPKPFDAEQWRRRLSLAADPGLRVDVLVEEQAR